MIIAEFVAASGVQVEPQRKKQEKCLLTRNKKRAWETDSDTSGSQTPVEKCVCVCVCTCTRYLFIFKPPHFPLTLVMLFISCRKKELRGGKTRILREIALIPSKPGSSTDFVCIIDCVSRCKKTPPLKKQIIKTSIENVTDIS